MPERDARATLVAISETTGFSIDRANKRSVSPPGLARGIATF
jgi:hypothetical protein